MNRKKEKVMSLKSILLIIAVILISALILPKMFKKPLSPATGSVIAEASGSGSTYSAAVDAASNSEAVSVLGMINAACRMYGMEHSSPPANLAALVDAGQLRLEDMNGTRFSHRDYTIGAFGDLGNRNVGVLRATVVDTTAGKKYELIWNPAARKYQMTVK
jgi:competence protein ComGC